MSNAAKMKSKIEALLAKAERTDNEHERDAYTAKAQRLMLQWGIEEADLEARGEVQPEEIVEVHRDYRGQFSMAMSPFAHEVARGMGGIKILKAGSKANWRVYAIGHKTDVDNFWTLMNSLEVQALAALEGWWKDAPERAYLFTATEKWKARRQFILSFGYEVGRRLRALRQEVQAEATPGAALVLVSKDERVQGWVDQQYGGTLRKGRGYEAGAAGHAAGRAAGARANIGTTAVGTGTAGAIQ